jgi:drug/metabolite transporter (DMT)-like permease
VLLLATLLARLLRDVVGLPRLLTRLAGETLFLYLSHVVILYADHVGLEARLRDGHSPLFGVLLALGLLLSCAAAALVLRSLRRRSGSGTRGAQSP